MSNLQQLNDPKEIERVLECLKEIPFCYQGKEQYIKSYQILPEAEKILITTSLNATIRRTFEDFGLFVKRVYDEQERKPLEQKPKPPTLSGNKDAKADASLIVQYMTDESAMDKCIASLMEELETTGGVDADRDDRIKRKIAITNTVVKVATVKTQRVGIMAQFVGKDKQ